MNYYIKYRLMYYTSSEKEVVLYGDNKYSKYSKL